MAERSSAGRPAGDSPPRRSGGSPGAAVAAETIVGDDDCRHLNVAALVEHDKRRRPFWCGDGTGRLHHVSDGAMSLVLMALPAFPVAYTSDVEAAASFWELLRFRRHVQLPPEGDPGYVGLTRDGGGELAVTHTQWAADRYGLALGGPRFEMYVYVDDLDATLVRLIGADVKVLREARTRRAAGGSRQLPLPRATRSLSVRRSSLLPVFAQQDSLAAAPCQSQRRCCRTDGVRRA
jgi:lactoylglutathione lyase